MKVRTVLAALVWTPFLLSFVAIGIVSAQHGMGVPKGALFSPIPADGPYLLDDHGQFTEVDRETYTFLEWGFRIMMVTGPIGAVSHWALTRRSRRSIPSST
jgi:hypothetical protein